MQIILLSGGSGTRLWPLSNDARSKQFLRLLPTADGRRESMIQRVVRQIKEAGLDADLTVATSEIQKDSVMAQIGADAEIVTEPCRRDTFPAICLACQYLAKAKGCGRDEVVVVMPCDPYTKEGYFTAIGRMAEGIRANAADLMVMGIRPTYPSAKYGYVVPEPDQAPDTEYLRVKRFTEKPTVEVAEELIAEGAMWNGGVFAFRLGYLTDICDHYMRYDSFEPYADHYADFPKISFDYEVAEKARNIGMVLYNGEWKDLGTWNTLTDELSCQEYGNVTTDGTCRNTHLFNELGVPMLCLGTENLIVAASPDGIIISEKRKSENVKSYAAQLKRRPMYEERRWGEYTVIDSFDLSDGQTALTKRMTLNADAEINPHVHHYNDILWTVIDGTGTATVDGRPFDLSRGSTITITHGQEHSLRAITPLTLIEVRTNIGDL